MDGAKFESYKGKLNAVLGLKRMQMFLMQVGRFSFHREGPCSTWEGEREEDKEGKKRKKDHYLQMKFPKILCI